MKKEVVRRAAEAIHRQKREPEWVLKKRLLGVQAWQKQNLGKMLPGVGELISQIDAGGIRFYKEVDDVEVKTSWDEVPREIRETFETLGIPEAEKEGSPDAREIGAVRGGVFATRRSNFRNREEFRGKFGEIWGASGGDFLSAFYEINTRRRS